jgi:GAF domain-containing protein
VIEGRTVHIPDVLEDPEFARADTQSLIGFRAALGVPLLREGNLIGIMAFQRFKPGCSQLYRPTNPAVDWAQHRCFI